MRLTPQESESETLFQTPQSRQSHFQNAVLAAVEVAASIDPYEKLLPEGLEVPALDACNWFGRNVDIRPKLVDKSSGVERLIDTGAQISATVRLPGDKPDNSVSLVAVNGSRICTYGVREIKLTSKTTFSNDQPRKYAFLLFKKCLKA